MNKRKVENYMSKAIEILRQKFKDKPIPREFRGYISQFGASIIQSGLMPAVAFFQNSNSESKKERPFIIKAIFKMIDEEKSNKGSLLEYIDKYEDKEYIKEDILNAAIALKLVLKSFDFEKSTN